MSSHQEDFYAFAALSLEPEELRSSVKISLGLDWDPEIVGDVFNRQVVFIGIYDGYGSFDQTVAFRSVTSVMAGLPYLSTLGKSCMGYLNL